MFRATLFVMAAVWCCSAYAQTADLPQLKAGDSWVVADTTEQGTQGWVHKDNEIAVERVQSDGLLIAVKEQGSALQPVERMVGLDWSRTRSVNGKQQIVNQPLSFPLKPGKKWTLDYTELNPNPQHSSESYHRECAVTGWESIQVKAGTYNAAKVECEGQWTAVVAPALVSGHESVVNATGVAVVAQNRHITPKTFTGRLYEAVWYVPAEKRFVKSVEEYYDANGVRSKRNTEELVSSKVSS